MMNKMKNNPLYKTSGKDNKEKAENKTKILEKMNERKQEQDLLDVDTLTTDDFDDTQDLKIR